MALSNGLFIAEVMHQRHAPKEHKLKYTVYYLSFPIQRMKEIASKLLSLKHFNLFSYYERDHGFGGLSNEAWVKSVLSEWKLTEADGEVVLITLPRVLGYAFNPVSFWFCLDKAGAVRAVISEVNNTFNERHCYVSMHDDHRPITQDDMLDSHKVFHVSPFLEVTGHYRFRFAYREDRIGVWIDYYKDGIKMLSTALVGKRHPLTDAMLLRCFFRYPLITIKVIGLIHYHALKLVTKGIRYRRKPIPPTQEITR